jgi:hypothetical protein
MATTGGYGNRWQQQGQWQRHFWWQWWQAATVVMAGYDGGEGKSSVDVNYRTAAPPLSW